MSFASVLVISVKVRRFSRKVLPSASAALLRTFSLRSWSRLSVGSMASVLAPTLKRRLATVSSNSRFQAAWPVTDFS